MVFELTSLQKHPDFSRNDGIFQGRKTDLRAVILKRRAAGSHTLCPRSLSAYNLEWHCKDL